MLEYIPDPIELYNEYDARRQRELEALPRCNHCGTRITDIPIVHEGETLCDSCYSKNFDEEIEDND